MTAWLSFYAEIQIIFGTVWSIVLVTVWSTGGGGGGSHTLYWRDKHFRTLRNRLIGQKVIKQFPGFGDFEGTVRQYGIETDNYTVLYDDGDEETMTYQDLCDLDITPRKSRKRKRSGGTLGKKERASRARRLHRERDDEVKSTRWGLGFGV